MAQSRKQFLAQMGILSGATLLGASSNIFASVKASSPIKFGYAAITWGDHTELAIKDISTLGFSGIQLRSNVVKEFGQNPEVLKKLLDDAKLKLIMLSSGNATINTGNDEAIITQHVDNAKFAKALGGNYIQLISSSRPKTGAIATGDLEKCGQMLTEIGKRTAAFGVEVAYHNHMGALGQVPEETDILLKNTDPKYVNFLLDIAHYQQGGGDPAAAILKYKDRIKCLHIKDVKNNETDKGYQFVELGQGRVNLPAVFAALKTINYKGYAVIELDAVPVKGRTPLESGQITKDYLKNTLKFSI